MAKAAAALEDQPCTIALGGSRGSAQTWSPGFEYYLLKIMTLVSIICNCTLIGEYSNKFNSPYECVMKEKNISITYINAKKAFSQKMSMCEQ